MRWGYEMRSFGSLSVADLAKSIASYGRNGDTMLAHITPKEAAWLKARGGSGTKNPVTGLDEFFDFDYDPGPSNDVETYTPPSSNAYDYTAPPSNYVQTSPSSGSSDSSGSGGSSDSSSGASDSSGGSSSFWSLNAPSTASQTDASGASGNLSGPGLNPSGSKIGLQMPSVPGATSAGGAPGLTTTTPDGQALGAGGTNTAPTPDASNQQNQQNKNQNQSWLGGLSTWANQNPGMVKALGVGGLGLINQLNASGARRAGAQAAGQFSALGTPLVNQGNALVSAGQTGQLTPAMQQQLQALRAKATSDLMRSGVSAGTASLQAEAVVQQQAQQFAQQLISQGMQLIQQGNTYESQAINAGYASNREAQQASTDFYTALAKMVMTPTSNGRNSNG
jgi:hypothetical protein